MGYQKYTNEFKRGVPAPYCASASRSDHVMLCKPLRLPSQF